MDLSKLGDKTALIDIIRDTGSDPFAIIIIAGLGGIVVMLILLKLAFSSMKKADRKNSAFFQDQ